MTKHMCNTHKKNTLEATLSILTIIYNFQKALKVCNMGKNVILELTS